MNLWEIIRRDPAYGTTLYALSKVAYGSYGENPGMALAALSPYGFTSEDFLIWGPQAYENCLFVKSPTEIVVAFHGLTSINEAIQDVLGSAQVPAPLGPGRIAEWAVDKTLTGIIPILDYMENYSSSMGLIPLVTTLVGHSQGCGQMEVIRMLMGNRPALANWSPAMIRFGSPRVLDPVAGSAVRGPACYVNGDYDPVPELPPISWYDSWPAISTWFGPTSSYRHYYQGVLLTDDGRQLGVGPHDEDAKSVVRILSALDSVVADPYAHLIGTYRDRLAFQAGAPGAVPTNVEEFDMPAAVVLVADDILEVTFQGVADGQQIINRVHYQVGALASGSYLDSLSVAGYMKDLWVANMLPMLASSYALVQVEVRKITAVNPGTPTTANPRPFVLDYSWATVQPGLGADVGSRTGDPLPTYATVSVRKITSYAGRYWRGGLHLGPVSESDTEAGGNTLVAAYRGLVQTAINAILAMTSITHSIAAGGTFDFNAGILSGTYGAWIIPTTAPLFSFAQLTSNPVSAYVGTQTSRKRRLA